MMMPMQPKLTKEEMELRNLMQAEMMLNQVGMKKEADEVSKKISDKIEFVEIEDWMDKQIHETFPKVDIRCMAFCCSPTKNCPVRNFVLKKLGKTEEEYAKMKKEFGEDIKKKL